ncbi:S8 family serine peptidase, partial [Streptomyces althioticus]|uniref:S8 family peptidase n=1 Tax=Streptomyces althioticus TaxID=83380 RepID=UPI003414C19A
MVVKRSGRHVRRNALSKARRWGATVCSVLGAVAVLSVSLASGAVAADAQSEQWYLSAMKTGEMWKTSTGAGVKVAVIDSGVNPDTPALRGQVVTDEGAAGVTYKATEDFEGHGTTMAELIAGTGAGGGLKGLAPGAKIVPYRISLEGMEEAEAKRAPDLADVIRAVADSDVKIISMSFGKDVDTDDEREAIKYAHAKGKLMFASTGNDAERNSRIGYPAAYPYVVGVAASYGQVGTARGEVDPCVGGAQRVEGPGVGGAHERPYGRRLFGVGRQRRRGRRDHHRAAASAPLHLPVLREPAVRL